MHGMQQLLCHRVIRITTESIMCKISVTIIYCKQFRHSKLHRGNFVQQIYLFNVYASLHILHHTEKFSADRPQLIKGLTLVAGPHMSVSIKEQTDHIAGTLLQTEKGDGLEIRFVSGWVNPNQLHWSLLASVACRASARHNLSIYYKLLYCSSSLAPSRKTSQRSGWDCSTPWTWVSSILRPPCMPMRVSLRAPSQSP